MRPFVIATAAIALFAGTLSGSLIAATVTYDPALNSLPQDQGFTLTEGLPASPAPTVSGGILSQGPTTLSGTQFFERDDVAFNFANGFTLTVTLKVIDSTYDPSGGGPGSQRSGWNMEGVDSLGRRFIVGIDNSGVIVNTDATLATTNGFAVRPFNTTDGFHQYQIIVSDGMGKLLIDGVVVGSAPMGGAVDPGTANRVHFGDGTGAGSSQTQLRFFQYADIAQVAQPQLSVARVANSVLLAWPVSATNFVLQSATNILPTANWTTMTNVLELNGGTNSVNLQIDTPQRFFRLKK